MIKTKRLILVPFSKHHLSEEYVSWLNDKEIMKYSDQRFIEHTISSCYDYWKSFEKSANQFWAITLKDQDNKHIGNITTTVDTFHNVTDISILIGERKIWGKGYGLEAWLAICDHLFTKKKVRKITAGTLEVNKPMLKLMEKSNMIEDGRRRHHCLFEQKEVDVIYASLFNKD